MHRTDLIRIHTENNVISNQLKQPCCYHFKRASGVYLNSASRKSGRLIRQHKMVLLFMRDNKFTSEHLPAMFRWKLYYRGPLSSDSWWRHPCFTSLSPWRPTPISTRISGMSDAGLKFYQKFEIPNTTNNFTVHGIYHFKLFCSLDL